MDQFCCPVIVPRMRSKSTQGGGMVFLYKKHLEQKISVCEIIKDSIIVIKIDRSIFLKNDEDRYLVFVYIPPYKSVFYKQYDVNDLFEDLESVLENYSTKGISFICGDTNSRTSTYDDFIKEDNLPESLVDLTSYSADSQLSLRVNPDLKTNTWGLKLLSLCKSSGFRIVNGRHSEGYANGFTYCGANGTSVNDYLITQEQNFELIRKFIVCSFTTFSDHAPLHFEFDSVQQQQLNSRSAGIPENDVLTVIKWKDENKFEIREAFRVNYDQLNSCFENRDLSSDADIDTCVESFSDAVVAIAEPFCKVTTRHKSGHKNAKLNFDKPWFSDELKALRRNYIRALNAFNSNSSTNNHKTLNECKKTYKLKERYLKRQYMKQEGDMLSVIRKTNPKLFYAKFKPKKKTLKSNLKLDDFYEHFKNLGLEMNLDSDNASTEEGNCCVFDELDAEITSNEVEKIFLHCNQNNWVLV
ncbi:unnamed protein product [Mytilus edulis]|uniref:Endonuclease/exonuclease/phosphatase domain-containing protein n=1 Tax=Mytilus edulis TaxID=6550 RepID=A0A8S3R9V1_MYTED|nr:unnamed protein product [Mytilus edulis]